MKRNCLIALLGAIFCQISLAQDVYVNIENDAVHEYMSEVYYERDDTSVVRNYVPTGNVRSDIPRPAVIAVPQVEADTITVQYVALPTQQTTTIGVPKGATEVVVYNLLPQCTYHYRLLADGNIVSEGEIITSGQVRMVYTPHVRNVRDLGGWPCVGNKIIRYGKLFRGAELNGGHSSDSTDLAILTDEIGIAAELDMRADYNEGHNVSAFGFLNANQVGSGNVATYYYTTDSGQLPEHLTSYSFQYRWRREFEFIINNMKQGRPVYIHCVNGANRTGYLALLLEGLLGVEYSDLVKDYELTTFGRRTEVKETIDLVINFINSLEGETLQDKFNDYFVRYLNVSQTNINYFRSQMLEENTATGIFDNNRETITNNRETITNNRYYDLLGRRVNYEKDKHYRSCLQRGAVLRTLP